jgi:hypothetical protein
MAEVGVAGAAVARRNVGAQDTVPAAQRRLQFGLPVQLRLAASASVQCCTIIHPPRVTKSSATAPTMGVANTHCSPLTRDKLAPVPRVRERYLAERLHNGLGGQRPRRARRYYALVNNSSA